MVDLIYFALGTLVEMGVRPGRLFDIVHEANMKKLWPDGKVHYAEDGKVIKHPSWQPPEPQLMREIDRQLQETKGAKSSGYIVTTLQGYIGFVVPPSCNDLTTM